MRILRARNVNDLLVQGLELLSDEGLPSSSRAGPVVVTPFPVMSVYEQPCERVLFDPVRDANPFFHLMEGLWMLAGRNDAAFLNRYITDFGERFAESATGRQNWEQNGVIHDAYGHRWRKALCFDQLDVIVSRLQKDSTDRQCVLQMWDASENDTSSVGLEGQNDLLGSWKTRPCNTHAYLRVRGHWADGLTDGLEISPSTQVLDMTILCRSNDIVWGAYGANAVHFSMLLEYMAGRIGVGVGTLYQFSNNFHGYVNVLDKFDDPAQMADSDLYDQALVYHLPMATDWSKWDGDLRKFMAWHDWLWAQPMEPWIDMSVGVANQPVNSWFLTTAVRVVQSRWLWKAGKRQEAQAIVDEIEAPDWRMACQQWMERRIR